MATQICITPTQEEKLKKAIANGEFSLEKIQKTKSSAERIQLIDGFLDNPDISKKVVREMEKRINSKKDDIFENYIKTKLTSVPESTRKGTLNRFKKMKDVLGAKEEKDFVEELVAHKFGAYISKEEANKFEKLTTEAIVLREKIDPNAQDITPESREYGAKLVELENAESRILVQREGFSFKDYQKLSGQKGGEAVAGWSKYLANATVEASASSRSFLATGDVSALFRQLWKIFSSGVTESTLSFGQKNDNLKIWWEAVKVTGMAIKQTSKYGDERVYDAVRAEVLSHPNSYNGLYDAAANSYGLKVSAEEQFPSSVPSEIFDKFSKKGNVFKISEVAFNAAILKARFDLANTTIATLKKDSNMMDPDIANAAGEFVAAFTGRGGLGPLEGKAATLLNKIFFAPKYASSQFSPLFQIGTGLTTRADNLASRLAMKKNMEFIIGSVGMLVAAESARSFIMGDEADYQSPLNPLSNRFGRVTFPNTNTTIDLTGGNRSVATLMGNILSDRYYDGRLGVWRDKSFFQQSDGSAIYDFAAGKVAPVPAVVLDLLEGEHFGGKEISTKAIVKNLITPITVSNVVTESMLKEDMSAALLVLTAESLGFGSGDMRFRPGNKEWKALLNSDEKAYWKAVDQLWTEIQTESKKLRSNEAFQALTADQQTEKLERIYNIRLKRVIKQQEFREISAEKLAEMEAKND